MHLTGKNLTEVSFPVGGIGAGCIGIDGAGHLAEWEILNKAGKRRLNGCSHFAVRAESRGKVRDARILAGPLEKDLTGSYVGEDAMFRGFGWGPEADTFCGFPHFSHVEMDGAFPAAEYNFSDKHFPGKVSLCTWSPFVPGESDLSSMPCAMFEITLENSHAEAYDYTCIGVLSDLWDEGDINQVTRKNGITCLELKSLADPDSCEYGELALSTDSEKVSYQEYFYRGNWVDYREVYAHDLFTPGPFVSRSYPARKGKGKDHGLLAVHFHLDPGEKKTVRFIISWYVPNRKNTWTDPEVLEKLMKQGGVKKNQWKNYYTRLCSSAVNASALIFRRYDKIRNQVFTFRKAIHESTLPKAVLEGAAENLAVLVTPVCLRLEDGTFWGWEGIGVTRGSCHGTCQHVWNYAQALSLLFPDLERSIREAMFKYNLQPDNRFPFRISLPLGTAPQDDRTAADGAFGEIMKTYREWKISGDTEWMKKMYPYAKRVMSFAWDPKSWYCWDVKKTGVMTGKQHHTLDMELFGPSGWLQSHYLGALEALARMAEACDEPKFAAECRAIARKDREYTERELFNGEYYIQKVDLEDISLLTPYLGKGEKVEDNMYWDKEHHEIKYQQGEGCAIDSHLGQWYASLYGLGEILSPEQIRDTLTSIYRYNFRKDMSGFVNSWRVFSLEHEAGTIICTWPSHVRKPVIPLPYNSETMTGFEWAAACHSIMTGQIRNGERMAKAIRDRYNGANRNPWNEIECGSNYARSMAAYAMLQAYSGFQYDMTIGRIGFSPLIKGDFSCFWSLGIIWGVYERKNREEIIRILHGTATLKEFALAGNALYINGKIVPCAVKNGILSCTVKVQAGTELVFRSSSRMKGKLVSVRRG